MVNTCANCGEYKIDKIIDLKRSTVICPLCQHEHSFIFKTLLIVTGPSGAGKTTICQTLIGQIPNIAILEGDILINDYFNSPQTNYKEYFELWLRICKNLHQSGINVVLFNSGMGVPENIRQCKESIYFKGFKYLNLSCSEETLVNRLNQRPAWRNSANVVELKNQLGFKQWLDKEHAGNTIDTGLLSVAQTSELVKEWIINNLN